MCYSEKGICASLSSLQASWMSSLSLSPPSDSQINQEQPSDSILGLIVFAWEMVPSQGCIIQIAPLSLSKVTLPWVVAATPNMPVLCYKTSVSGYTIILLAVMLSLSSYCKPQISSLSSLHVQCGSYCGMPSPIITQINVERQAALML